MERSRAACVGRRIERTTGLHLTVREAAGVLRVAGVVGSAEERLVVEDLARTSARGAHLECRVLIAARPLPDFDVPDLPTDGSADTRADAAVWIGRGSPDDEALGEGGVPYFPPTDPVVTPDERGNPVMLGGFAPTSMSSVEVDASASDARYGDAALADAIARELREDAATTDLSLDVTVRRGVVRLRGLVQDLDDAENAEAVAARVPGVVAVVDGMVVRGL